jgi:pimeloyl-ACP methyl ester carboxylesterase
VSAGPTPEHGARLEVRSTDGVRLALHDLGGDGPPLLFCHPTGFHARIWEPVAEALAREAHCWAIDFRGHGDSGAPASGSFSWDGMAGDVLAVADELGGPLLGAGHSMGGAALLLAEQARPGLFGRLWCFEPIVFPAEGALPLGENPMAAAARRRKAVFPDHDTAIANYAAKPPLNVFHPAALEAYVFHGFRSLPEGGVELKCSPETEARVFEGGMTHGAFARLGEVTCPTTVVASGDGSHPAQVAPIVAEALPHGRLEEMRDLSHFGPMEDPRRIAQSIRTSLLAV